MDEVIKMRYPVLKTVTDIDKAIEVAVTAAKTMKQKVQYAAIGCMILSALPDVKGAKQSNSDLAIDKANYLVDQLGAGIKGEGLVKYMVQFCGFEINEAARDEGFARTKGSDFVRKNLEKAKKEPWYGKLKPNPFKGFNLNEELGKLLARANTMQETAGKDEKKAEKIAVDVDMLETLNCLIGGRAVTHKNALQLVEKLIPDAPLEAPEAQKRAA